MNPFSLIPRDFLVPKVHVHSFEFPKRVAHFKLVGPFPKKRSGCSLSYRRFTCCLFFVGVEFNNFEIIVA